MAELIENPETYSAKWNTDTGVYEDILPATTKAFNELYKNGLMCCNGNTFTNRTRFKAHLKTKVHKDWLESFKHSGDNDPVKKNLELEKTIKNQQIITGHLSNENFRLRREIGEIKEQMGNPEVFYIIRDRESIRMKEKVFKIGITKRNFLERFKGYPSGSVPVCVFNVKESKIVEDRVKCFFKKKYKLVRGHEYFEGRRDQMILDATRIIREHERND